MQLGEAEALRVLDDHERGIGDVNAHFDDRGGDQQLDAPGLEFLHHLLLLGGLQATMHQANGDAPESLARVALAQLGAERHLVAIGDGRIEPGVRGVEGGQRLRRELRAAG